MKNIFEWWDSNRWPLLKYSTTLATAFEATKQQNFVMISQNKVSNWRPRMSGDEILQKNQVSAIDFSCQHLKRPVLVFSCFNSSIQRNSKNLSKNY